jgi:sugar lactone lactonase YvrE
VAEFTSAGAAGANSYQGTGVAYPFAVAIDGSNRQWVVDQSSNALTVLSAGAPIAGSPFSGGGLSTPNAIVLDGNGTAWVSNANGSVSAFTTAGVAITPSTGYAPGSAYANGIAVDGSGSLWITDCGSYCGGTGPGSVFQVMGAATPVVTPIAYGAAHNSLGTQP